MIYREFKNLQLSALGLGTMRLPVIDGDNAKIDEAAVAEMVAYAMENGINYYDTAYGYHEEQSEIVVGRVLSSYPRDSFYLASKFPGYDLANIKNAPAVFEEQLEKCQVDYFDFYLVHNVNETNIDNYLNEEYGLRDYLVKQKEAGRIKHLGFSTHGSLEVTKRFLDGFGDCIEFCQVQLNYLDWSFQDAKAKVELAKSYGIPVWVMEPLRGGQLATISPDQMAQLKELRPTETVPAWAFRFLQSIPEVKMVLSGMSNMQQLKDNIETFSEDKPLNKVEWEAVQSVAKDMLEKIALPCTSCRYCTSYCPQGLDIPYLISLYNQVCVNDGTFIARMGLTTIDKDKYPDACIGCQGCEAACPQQIKIAAAMEDFAARLR